MRLSEFLRLAIPSVGVACFIVGILAIVYLIYIFKSKKISTNTARHQKTYL